LIENLRDAVTGARALLGCRLVRASADGRRVGLIVETEAYPEDDPACHAFGGRTRRNAAMFESAGTAYVYRIHRSHCLNVVSGPAGSGQAVLIRAIEPLNGVELMERARRRATVGRRPPTGAGLTNGPGKVCQALEIDLDLDGHDLTGITRTKTGLYLLPRKARPTIECSPRIGISRAREAPLRFFVAGNAWVSRPVAGGDRLS
jgi:DNA-3-methyladenine glycosylase